MKVSPRTLKAVTWIVLLPAWFIVTAMYVQHWRANALIDQAWKIMGTGDRTKVVEQLKRAESISFKDSSTWSRLCGTYRTTEDFDLAIHACKEQLKLNSSVDSWFDLGLVYWDVKDYFNAASAFEKAAKRSDFDISHDFYIYSLVLSKQYEKAIPAAQEYLGIWKANPTADVNADSIRHLLAIAYDGAGQTGKAQQIYQLDHLRSCHVMDHPYIEGGSKGLVVPCDPETTEKTPIASVFINNAK